MDSSIGQIWGCVQFNASTVYVHETHGPFHWSSGGISFLKEVLDKIDTLRLDIAGDVDNSTGQMRGVPPSMAISLYDYSEWV